MVCLYFLEGPKLRMIYREGDVVYPYGNSARAVVVDFARNGKVVVEFLDHCIADFGWYRRMIFEKGYQHEINPGQIHEQPRGE